MFVLILTIGNLALLSVALNSDSDGAKTEQLIKSNHIEQGEKDSGQVEEVTNLFALSSESIKNALDDGVNNRFLQDYYRLPRLTSYLKHQEIHRVIIRPPYEQLAAQARKVYFNENRALTNEEIEALLKQNTISFTVYFNGNNAYFYDVALKQGEQPIPYESKLMSDDGSVLTVTFQFDDIDFKSRAVLQVYQKERLTQFEEYEVVFTRYVQ